MEKSKKFLLAIAIFCACGVMARAADIEWTATSGTVPDDGNTYFIENNSITLDNDLIVNGILELRTSGTLNTTTGNDFFVNNTLTVTGGTINVTAGSGSLHIGNNSTGVCNLISGWINTSGSGSIYVGLSSSDNIGNGTLNMSGGVINLTGATATLQIGAVPSDSGTATGTLNFSAGTITIATTVPFRIGPTTIGTSIATVNMTGGNLACNGDMELNPTNGLNNTIELNISGGTVTCTKGLDNYGSTINLSGGTLNNQGSGAQTILLSLDGNNIGTINITGGTFNSTSNATFLNGIGAPPASYLNMSGGTFNMTSGTIKNGSTGTAVGIIAVTGGTFNLEGGTITNGDASGTTGFFSISDNATFNLDAGSISAGVGTSNIGIFAADTTGISSGSMTIPSGKIMILPTNGTLIVNTGGTLINNGTIVRLLNNSFDTTNGTFTNNGTILDFTSDKKAYFPENTPIRLLPGETLSIDEEQILTMKSFFHNQSDSTFNIYGTVYTYSTIQNGTLTYTGNINVNYPGKLYLLSGSIENKHADSAINVNTGGKLLNYYGLVDTVLGTITTNTGGFFDNVRGGTPGDVTDNGGIVFDDNKITLIDTIEIDYTWTITEKATLNGDGHKIIFGTDGAIFVRGRNASLLIKNAIVEDVSGNQIRCSDNTTTLSVEDVVWIQDANYSFSKGTISVNGEWLVTGADTSFTYSSDQTSTIQQNAELIFDRNVTFSYDSPAATNVAMIDATSILHFNGSTLKAEDNLRLTKGKIIFDDNTTFDIDTGKTIYFGNNSAPDNVTLRFDTDSQFVITGAGTLVNQNV
jgi:hypothetical protein